MLKKNVEFVENWLHQCRKSRRIAAIIVRFNGRCVVPKDNQLGCGVLQHGDEASSSLMTASRVSVVQRFRQLFRKRAKIGRADRAQADTWTELAPQCLNG